MKPMDWKEFFRPGVLKLTLFLLLMAGINYWIISTTVILDARILVGLPLGFWPVGSFMARLLNSPAPPKVVFSWLNFFADVIFWYLAACSINHIFMKTKKRYFKVPSSASSSGRVLRP
jgi:hypothetical protein